MSRFSEHYEHDLVVAKYTDGVVDPVYSIECETCYEVVLGEEFDF